MNTQQAYFIGTKNVDGSVVSGRNYSATEQAVYVSSCLPHNLIPELVKGNFSGVILGYESPFSHLANVIRVIHQGRPELTAVLGIGSVWKHIAKGTSCKIKPNERKIISDDVSYSFNSKGTFIGDDIGISASNNHIICYKPFFFYNPELSDLICKGYNIFCKKIFRCNYKSFTDPFGQVWLHHKGLPSSIAKWAIKKPNDFIRYAAEYGKVLRSLNEYSSEHGKPDASYNRLKKILISHYFFSPLLSFSAPYLAEKVSSKLSANDFESILNFIASLSNSIRSSQISIEKALDITLIINNYLLNYPPDINSSYEALYEMGHFPRIKRSSLLDVSILSFLYSEIRRSVISNLRKNCKWFNSITKHRDEIDLDDNLVLNLEQS